MKVTFLAITLICVTLNRKVMMIKGEETEEQDRVNFVGYTDKYSKGKTKKAFGQELDVEFVAANPTKKTYVGIFPKRDGEEFGDTLSLWSDSCGGQTQKKACAIGRIIFNAFDPSYDENEQIPLNPGDYQLCLMDETDGYPGVQLACEDFTVKEMKKKLIGSSKIRATKNVFEVGEPITVKFFTKKPVVKQWVGLYRLADVVDVGEELPDDGIYWIYTGCNNQSGDQEDNNDCANKLKKGSISFEADTLDRDSSSTPDWADAVPAGEYILCLCFNHFSPYTQFKCGEFFTVIDPADD